MNQVVQASPAERHRDLFRLLVEDIAEYNPVVDRDLLERAFVFASEAHEGQQRRSGEDFILHPLGVARVLSELRQDDETIAAALLHDVVEDTEVSPDDVATRFGDLVAAETAPIDDVRGTAAYRRRALAVLARRTLAWAWADLGGDARCG